jgi:hypothetical protein
VVVLLLTACGGANDETLLDELRVLSMLPQAPEIAPGETTTMDVRIVDPDAGGYRALVWTCTQLGEDCLEDEEGRTPALATVEDGRAAVPVTASMALAAVASDSPLPLVSVWALACADDACPLLDEVERGDTIDADVWADPTDWMSELPIEGTSLALSSVQVSTRAADTRHVNPTITVSPEAPSVTPGGSVEVEVAITGELGSEARVWGYTTAGGFERPSDRPNARLEARLDWIAPATAGSASGFLLLVDDEGGGVLWEGTLTAE